MENACSILLKAPPEVIVLMLLQMYQSHVFVIADQVIGSRSLYFRPWWHRPTDEYDWFALMDMQSPHPYSWDLPWFEVPQW